MSIKLDGVEFGATYWAAVGPFHPRCQTIIVKFMITRFEMGYKVELAINESMARLGAGW